jgi:hypothetical protein
MNVIVVILALQASGIDLAIRRAARQDDCTQQPAGDAIVVCGRRDRNERYRTRDPNPSFDWHGDVKSVMRERMSWGDAGDTGPQSCGPVGPGGWTGCLIQRWKRNDQQNPRRQ